MLKPFIAILATMLLSWGLAVVIQTMGPLFCVSAMASVVPRDCSRCGRLCAVEPDSVIWFCSHCGTAAITGLGPRPSRIGLSE